MIIGTAGRTGTGITGAILYTVAVVAEEGAVGIGVGAVDVEVDGFTDPASEGVRVVVGVGICDTEDRGIVVAGIETSDRTFLTSDSETGTGTVTGVGTGVGTKAGIGTGAETGAAAVVIFLRRRRLLAGNGSSGADNHGSLIN